MKKTCGTCDYYENAVNPGLCMRFPPTVVPVEISKELFAGGSREILRKTCAPMVVSERPACGDHEPIVTEPETTGDEAMEVIDENGMYVSFSLPSNERRMTVEEVCRAMASQRYIVRHTPKSP